MFKHNNTMCCSTCFEEVHTILTDKHGKAIMYGCPKCGKLTDIFDEL